MPPNSTIRFYLNQPILQICICLTVNISNVHSCYTATFSWGEEMETKRGNIKGEKGKRKKEKTSVTKII